MSNTIPYRSPGTMLEGPKVKPGSLYDQDHRYTDKATELADEAYAALRPIFKAYFNAGYSPREIGHILQSVGNDLELEAVL